MGSRFQACPDAYIDGGAVVQMRDPGRRPSLGGKIMSLVLSILNVRCCWQSEGKCQVGSYIPRPGGFQSQSSENITFRMAVVEFELSKKSKE